MAQAPDVPADKGSPPNSGRSSPAPRAAKRAVEDGIYKGNKALRRYGANIERALSSWEVSPSEWADYIAFLGRLLKAIQTLPQGAPLLPHSDSVAYKLAQCLNPALPSGVHQKALEVYDYIFSTFGQTYVADHLHEFLPGLAAVLSFGSLSVRPAFYSIYERYILCISSDDLRPILKSLILSLLPGLEDETSEDFEQAFRLLNGVRQHFAESDSRKQSASETEGYFWQCLFLAVISNPSRRQGALNFLIRKLPSFRPDTGTMNSKSPHLQDDARRIVSPEPGLLIRCFVCGLSDPQLLIQRGFLDLLVSNLPLNSPLFKDIVGSRDLDLLTTATTQVLLRRERGLNRRLWSWFLGPQSKADATEDAPQPDHGSTEPSVEQLESSQYEYFSAYGKKSLERCLLAMFKRDTQVVTERAKPFRICLSLMDSWEIGGSLVLSIFRPAMESAFRYTQSASTHDVAELMRSASEFFDGVEVSLIWADLMSLLQTAMTTRRSDEDLAMFKWIIQTFNVKDEDMALVHIPYAATYLLALLQSSHTPEMESNLRALELVITLLDMVPSRAFASSRKKSAMSNGNPSFSPDAAVIRLRLEEFYQSPENVDTPPFNGSLLLGLLIQLSTSLLMTAARNEAEALFSRSASILTVLISKTSGPGTPNQVDITNAVSGLIKSATVQGQVLAFPTLSSIVSLAKSIPWDQDHQALRLKTDSSEIEPLLITQLWEYLSPSRPKYHVEAVKMMWQLYDLLAVQDCLQSSLSIVMRRAESSNAPSDGSFSEALKRFSILWGHTVAAPTTPTQHSGLIRRTSGMTSVIDSKQSHRRQKVLMEPLMLILDLLSYTDKADVDIIKEWLHQLPTLPNIFGVHLDMLEEALEQETLNHKPEEEISSRLRTDICRKLEYILGHFRDMLSSSDEWTWQALDNAALLTPRADSSTTLSLLAECCYGILSNDEYAASRLKRRAVEVLQLLLTSPSASSLKPLEIDTKLIACLIECLAEDRCEEQDSFLRLLTMALRVRSSSASSPDMRPSSAAGSRKTSGTLLMPGSEATTTTTSAILPPEDLLKCLRLGFSSRCARPHLTRWLELLSNTLSLFPDAVFGGLISLVETICSEVDKAHGELQALAEADRDIQSEAPEAAIAIFMDMFQELLSQAHTTAIDDSGSDQTPKLPAQPRSLLGNVTTGIFKADGVATKSGQSNGRLNVVLAFQDVVRSSFELWTWASQQPNDKSLDKTSAATAAYNALRIRNRTRSLLEQTFAAEPLESLEVIIAIWCNSSDPSQTAAAIDLLHVMHGLKPRAVITSTLDALCSRTNTMSLSLARQSCQTTNLTALDITTFWSAYLQSIEDDAMDEIWADCMTLFKDVLANPQPYRQALSALISIVLLMAEKVDNTNFGEQRKMRRDLGDIFQRLLAATFASTSNGVLEANGVELTPVQKSVSLVVVLKHAVENIEPLLETADRATSMINTLSTNLIAPVFHSRFFPDNVTPDFLTLLYQITRKAPTTKSWKKEVTDAFNDSRILSTSTQLMSVSWFPVLRQWSLHDKERMPEILSRLTPPSSAGIMFGVGASAARQEADRRTQLNLRRLCLLLLASAEDAFVAHLRAIEEKLVELFDASQSSSPSSAIKSDLFMVCRTLVLSVSATHLGPLWPLFNKTMQEAMKTLIPSAEGNTAISNLSLLQACKLLDLLIAVAPDDFQLHEWLYVTDTIDAVYQPSGWNPAALSDQVAESLNAEEHEEMAVPLTPTATLTTAAGKRRPLLSNAFLPTKDDMKAMTRDDFARTVLLPYFSQLSIHAYEGFYSMEVPDLNVSRQNLLEDILDPSTIVD